MPMNEGKCPFIQYKTWTDRANWTATLQPLARQVTVIGIPTSVIDPDFHHVGPGPTHDDKWVQFFDWGNNKRGSLCHSHLDLVGQKVTFDFEHHNSDGSFDHNSGEITFIAWDETHWAASIDPVGIPDSGATIPLSFTLRRQ